MDLSKSVSLKRMSHFRLYFYDAKKRPTAVPSGLIVTLKTIRLQEAGAKQTFAFTEKDSFLKSTFDIPEPHNFEVVVTLTRDGKEEVYRTAFTEEAHGHSMRKTYTIRVTHTGSMTTDRGVTLMLMERAYLGGFAVRLPILTLPQTR